MVSTRQNHDDFCDHIVDIIDDLLDGATLNELLKIGRLIRLFEIHNIIPQLTIPFRLQSHHYTALPFLFKMNDRNTLDLAHLPMPRQIIVLLDVLAQQRTNVTTLVVSQGADRDFLQNRIDHHQRELREGIPLDFATAVQVSPLADRWAPPQLQELRAKTSAMCAIESTSVTKTRTTQTQTQTMNVSPKSMQVSTSLIPPKIVTKVTSMSVRP